MINNTSDQDPTLDTITRITPTMRGLARDEGLRWSADMGVSVALGLV
jgi:hypothetical protein